MIWRTGEESRVVNKMSAAVAAAAAVVVVPVAAAFGALPVNPDLPRVVIEGGNTQFFGEPIPAGKAVHLAFTYPASGRASS